MKGFRGGAGGDWGQRIGSEYMVGARTPTGVGGFLMRAGTADRVTEFDAWMYRDFWRRLKGRYGL
ncbi:hypothetical protein GCM10023237_64500 [Streptomyces coeruleoprunus]